MRVLEVETGAGSTPLSENLPVQAIDGSSFELLLVLPSVQPRELLYWVPAMGIAARHYLPFAQVLAQQGLAVAIHEWRGIGSSSLRAGRHVNWGYRQLLECDFPAGLEAACSRMPHARIWLGGHSLGGQLSSLFLGLHPRCAAGLCLVASGAPYWRLFKRAWLVGLSYVLAPWLARLAGSLPGRRIGFGGNEARGVIDDWARSGRSGKYTVADMPADIEAALGASTAQVLALRMRDDWLGPAASLQWLLDKMPHARHEVATLAPDELGAPADHFRWMKTPDAVAMRVARWVHQHTRN